MDIRKEDLSHSTQRNTYKLQDDDNHWTADLSPTFVLPGFQCISCFDILSTFTRIEYQETKRQALTCNESDSLSETKIMSTSPGVVWNNNSGHRKWSGSQMSSADSRPSTISLRSDYSQPSFDESSDASASKDDDDPYLSLYLTEAPLVDNRIHYRTVGNQALADVMAQAYQLSDLNIERPAKNWQSDRWRYIRTEQNVHILRKDTHSRSVYTIAGVGLIPRSPWYMFHILRDPWYRFKYDKLLKHIDLIEHVDYHNKVISTYLEAKHCLTKQCREILVVNADREQGSSFVIASTSTEHAKCPIKQGIERINMKQAGFVISPYFHNGQHCTKLTYILQVDMSDLPSFVVDLVMKHQPLAIAYIRNDVNEK